ncbi:hypothetical protein [Salibacterium qingdaonense]|nr:hypothetical protein [Salibacterium qingdaonense]
MNSEAEKPTKDIVWSVVDKEFAVRNVPFSRMDADGEEFLSLGVSAKLELIRELMLNDEVPHDVNFEDVADLKFSN